MDSQDNNFEETYDFQELPEYQDYIAETKRPMNLSNLDSIQLRPTPPYDFFSNNDMINEKIVKIHTLKRTLLCSFLVELEYSDSPSREEVDDFDPFYPEEILNDIDHRLQKTADKKFEKECRERYGWHGKEWYPYHPDMKWLYEGDKIITRGIKTNDIKREQLNKEINDVKAKEVEIHQKNIFRKVSNKLIDKLLEENKASDDFADKTRAEIISEHISNFSVDTHIDETPDDNSWTTIEIKKSKTETKGKHSFKKSFNRSHKKKRY